MINQKTVAKSKKRTADKDLPTAPLDAHSTVFGIKEKAIFLRSQQSYPATAG